MYIERLWATNFRCYEQFNIHLQYPGKDATLRFPNINLILGDNGSGKSAVMKAATLPILGSVLQSSGFRPYMLVRRRRLSGEEQGKSLRSEIRADLICHGQEQSSREDPFDQVSWSASIGVVKAQAVLTSPFGEDELNTARVNPARWERIKDPNSPAFFLAGYGANRQIEFAPTGNSSSRNRKYSARFARVAGLFEESVELSSVAAWSELMMSTGRLEEAVSILNSLLPEGTTALQGGEEGVQFSYEGILLPFAALSDGYRGFIAWVTDLVYQIVSVLPDAKTRRNPKITDVRGVVLVDEIDLHLHPIWQRTVVPTLSKAFPNIQFLLTTHSPIIAASLERANIFVAEKDSEMGRRVEPGHESIFGLSADQVLASSYFDVETSRPEEMVEELHRLAREAETNPDSAKKYLSILARGLERQS
ncbi:MAG: hypothetical protein EON58_03060 [Alphaproteobacteria bacterium]|nr:MAG: hypothetical protein EON58_03060 [Alphaproteobacteria bacterium]